MKSADGRYFICDRPNCDNRVLSHAWRKIKKDRWYIGQRQVYCPDHLPAWYVAWLAHKKY